MTSAVALRNGVNLAYWLYRVHPAIFNALAAQAPRTARLSGLGDDGVSFDTGSVPTFEIGTSDVGTTTTFDVSSQIDPQLLSLPDPVLTDVGIGAATSDVSVPIDTSVNAAPAASSTGLGSALGSVGSFLASATGLGAVTNLATAIYRSGTPQAATIATQVARVNNGASPAPITYAYNTQGQLVPVLSQAGGTSGLALTQQTLGSLVPSSWQRYAIPVGLGLLLLWALS